MSRAALGLLLFAGLLPPGGASPSAARTVKSPDGVEIRAVLEALSALENLLSYDAAAALAGVDVPIRLLNADRRSPNLEAARKHRTDLELAVMPGVGHFLMAEDPDEFNHLLARAVRELVTRRGKP